MVVFKLILYLNLKMYLNALCSFIFILDHDNSDSTVLDTSLSQMVIDSDKHEKHKKVKKSKKDRKIDYKSDSSSPLSSRRHRSPLSTHRRGSTSSSRRHGKIVTYSPSPSPSPERYLDIKVKEERYYEVKEESLEQPQHLFGSYHCDVIYFSY